MSIKPKCSHCLYFQVYYFFGEDNEEIKTFECDLNHSDVDEDQESCEDFNCNEIGKRLLARGILK